MNWNYVVATLKIIYLQSFPWGWKIYHKKKRNFLNLFNNIKENIFMHAWMGYSKMKYFFYISKTKDNKNICSGELLNLTKWSKTKMWARLFIIYLYVCTDLNCNFRLLDSVVFIFSNTCTDLEEKMSHIL